MSKIEWTDVTWNPVTGCDKISPGCKNCYAERMAKRLAGRVGYPADDPFRVTLHYDKLETNFGKKPKKIFVCSMSDLFHPDVPFWFIETVHDVIREWHIHTFQILTKRPERILEYYKWRKEIYMPGRNSVPPENAWYGVSVENQKYADERIPILLQIPAKVRFVSVEPMLGPIDLFKINGKSKGFGVFFDWVICGGESGPGARPMKLEWARGLRDQCKQMGVPFFFKQIDKKTPIPEDLNIREWPAGEMMIGAGI